MNVRDEYKDELGFVDDGGMNSEFFRKNSQAQDNSAFKDDQLLIQKGNNEITQHQKDFDIFDIESKNDNSAKISALNKDEDILKQVEQQKNPLQQQSSKHQ